MQTIQNKQLQFSIYLQTNFSEKTRKDEKNKRN